jgi:hypothetical protein
MGVQYLWSHGLLKWLAAFICYTSRKPWQKHIGNTIKGGGTVKEMKLSGWRECWRMRDASFSCLWEREGGRDVESSFVLKKKSFLCVKEKNVILVNLVH